MPAWRGGATVATIRTMERQPKQESPKSTMFANRLGSIAALLIAVTAQAQFGRTFSSSSYVPPTVNAAYAYASGQLAAVLETTPAADEAHLFVDQETGRLRGALRLDTAFRALVAPGAEEILVTGATTVPDPPGANQPVYFAGRYDAATLAPIAERQIDVDRDDGFNLVGQVAPDGQFVFHGTQAIELVNLIARYRADFTPRWGVALTYHGEPMLPGPMVYPLANGQTGFFLYFRKLNPDGTATDSHVLGLIDAAGALQWTAVVKTEVAALTYESFRFVFGSDGSLFGSKETMSLLGAETDTVRLFRLTPAGALAYSKTLTVPGGAFEWQYYLGDRALVAYIFQQGGADRIQFIALDASGNVSGNTALNCKLRGGGQIKFTAARRAGTDYAFIHMECGFTTLSPQQTLARLHLPTGAMEFRKLPQPLPGVETYEVVTTPAGDPYGHNNSFPAMVGVTTTIMGILNQAGGGSRVGFYELPANGDFPSCLSLGDSAVTLGTSLAVQLNDAPHVDLADGATVVAHAMPGMTAPRTTPTLLATPVTESTLCPDDTGTLPEVELDIVRVGQEEAEVRVPTATGFRYVIERSAAFTGWTEAAATDGTGSLFAHRISLTGTGAFFRCVVTRAGP